MKTIKKIFIEKGNTGLYSAFFINEDDQKIYIHGAHDYYTYLGCKLAMKKWLKENADTLNLLIQTNY